MRQKTANAESLHAAVKAEVETLRELKSEHEKSKNAMRDELAEERQANMLALEREVEARAMPSLERKLSRWSWLR